MAIQDSNGFLRGKVGSVIYRKWRELNLVQSVPRKKKKNKLSANTLAAAYEFGRASTMAKAIRSAGSYMFRQHDLAMPSRLVGAVLKGLRHSPEAPRMERDLHDADLSSLQGFEFNTDSQLLKILPVKPVLSKDEEGVPFVQIPSFKLKDLKCPYFRNKNRRFSLRIAFLAFDFREHYAEYVAVKEVMWDSEIVDAVDWKLDRKLPAGLVVMLCLSINLEVRYSREESTIVNQRDWSPCCIADAWHEPEADAKRLSAKERLHQHEQNGSGSFFYTLQLCGEYDKESIMKRLAAEPEEINSPQKKPEGIPKGPFKV